MNTTPSLTRLVGATAAALALTFGVAACGEDGSDPGSSAETSAAPSEEGAGLVGFGDEVGDPVTGSKPDRGEDVEGETLALPAGFPWKEVPLLDGRITSATGDGESGGWDVTIAVGCWDEIVCRGRDAGEGPETGCGAVCETSDPDPDPEVKVLEPETAYRLAGRLLNEAGFGEAESSIDGETYATDGGRYEPVVGGFAGDGYHVDVVAFGAEDGTTKLAYVVRPAN